MEGQTNSKKERAVLTPQEGGLIDKIEPLLQYMKPLPPPDSPARMLLFLKNTTHERLEGWLTLTAPPGWSLAPGSRLIIAIRAQGTISVEFYLFVPARPLAGPHLLQIKVTRKKNLLAKAAFDLRPGLLFLIDS